MNKDIPQMVVKAFFLEGMGNIVKIFFTLLSFDTNSKIENTDGYIFGNYDTLFDAKHVYKRVDDKYIHYLTGCRFTLLREDEEGQNDLSYYSTDIDDISINSDKFHCYFPISNFKIDMCYDVSKISEKIKNKFLSIKNSVSYTDIINLKMEQLLPSDNTLSISVRTWKCKHESNIHRDYDFDLYNIAIRDVVKKNVVTKIVLSVDNFEYLPPYIELFKELNIEYSVLYHDDDLNDLQNAFIKMYTLSRSSYFICNRISTFSEMVFWYSDCKIKVYTVC